MRAPGNDRGEKRTEQFTKIEHKMRKHQFRLLLWFGSDLCIPHLVCLAETDMKNVVIFGKDSAQ